jgi:polysaccharide export outer membrane protein
MSTLVAAFLIATAVVSAAQAPVGVAGRGSALPAPPAVPVDPPLRSAYVLGPDDQISVHVVDVPDISDRPQRIDPNGDLKLPMVGRVHASGMTIDQLESELRERFKTYLKEPDVTVSVGELRSQTVSIIGAVNTAGVHAIRGRETLIEVLSKAGGVRPEAGPIVRIVRRPNWDPIPLEEATRDPATGSSVVEIDLRALLDATAPEKNVALLPNDVISVPPAGLVYVVGEVSKTGALPLAANDGVTVLEALAASGGVLKTGAPNRARILRIDAATQTRKEIGVDVKKIMDGKAKDVTLFAGDILVVPDSSGKRMTTRAIEALVQVGTMIGTYGIVH